MFSRLVDSEDTTCGSERDKPSKIPNPTSTLATGSRKPRRLLNLSSGGSPHITYSPSAGDSIPPKVESKLPRTVLAPKHSLFAKSSKHKGPPETPRSNLSESQEGTILPRTNSLAQLDFGMLASPSNHDKPLPSPPFAQIVDPCSPPMAQRTLLDAQAVSQCDSKWPALQPENIPSPSENYTPYDKMHVWSGLSPTNSTPSPRVALAQIDNGGKITESNVPKPRNTRKSDTKLEVGSRTTPTPSQQSESLPAKSPRAWGSNNPYAKPLHAISAKNDLAKHSPASRKKNTPVLGASTQVSSKRSLPSLQNNNWSESAIAQISPLSNMARSVSEGSRSLGQANLSTNEASLLQQQYLQMRYSDVQPTRTFNSARPTSSSSMPTSAFTDANMEQDNPDSTPQFKHVSRRSSMGTLLRIAPDADPVLLSQSGAIPAVPALPKTTEKPKLEYQHSPNSVVSERSRQNTPQISMTGEPSALGPTTVGNEPHRRAKMRYYSKQVAKPAEMTEKSIPKEFMQVIPSSARRYDYSNLKMVESDTTAGHQEHTWKHRNLTKPSYESMRMATPVPQKAEKFLGMRACSAPTTGNISPFVPISSLPSTDSKSMRLAPDRYKARSPRLPTTNGQYHTMPSHVPSPGTTGNPTLRSSAVSSPDDSPKTTEKPKSRYRARGVPSPLSTTNNSEDLPVKEEKTSKDMATNIKSKRSFRDFFHKVESLNRDKAADAKRGSTIASSLRFHFRQSANTSKVNVSKTSEAGSQLDLGSKTEAHKTSTPTSRPPTAISSPEGPASPVKPRPRVTDLESPDVINNILDRVVELPEDSPGRLRGLDIAEAILQSIELYKEVKAAAIEANKRAKEANLKVERVATALEKLQSLGYPKFDDETLEHVQGLVKSAGVGEETDKDPGQEVSKGLQPKG